MRRRAILRFEELTDELERDLRDIIKPRKSCKDLPAFNVSFVSADRLLNLDCPQGHNCTRYYNLRLLKTFRLTDAPGETPSIEPALHWIRKNKNLFEPLFRSADYLEKHSHSHFDRFCQALEVLDSLLDGNNKLKGRDNRSEFENAAAKVHDLLIEAIAAMPYKGLLPGALDHIFFHEGWDNSFAQLPRFCLKFGDEDKPGKVWSPDCDTYKSKKQAFTLLKQAKELIPLAAFPDRQSSHNDSHALGTLYIDQFINWFTIGLPPDIDGADNLSPYKGAGKDLRGLALPVYHFHTKEGQPVGGFEGWLVLLVDAKTKPQSLARLSKCLIRDGAAALSFACRSFSRRVREERMRELVEKEWTTHTTDPRSFTLAHFPEYDGWTVEKEPAAPVPKKEDHWLFAFLMKNGVNFEIYDKHPHSVKTANSQEVPAVFHDIREATHIAVWPPKRKGEALRDQTPPLVFRKRDDTILPSDHNDLVAYGFHITQSIHQIYEAATLKQKSEDTATNLLAQDFAHQIQHVSKAIWDRWLISPQSWDGLISKLPIEEADQLRQHFKIAPIPGLFQHVSNILGLWSAYKLDNLFPSELRTNKYCTLHDVLSKASALAASEWIAFRSKGWTISTPQRTRNVVEISKAAKILVEGCSIGSTQGTLVAEWEGGDEIIIGHTRLFQALYFNAFRHANASVNVRWDPADSKLSLSNPVSDSRNSAGNGDAVIRNLAHCLGLSITEGTIHNGVFIRSITDTESRWRHL